MGHLKGKTAIVTGGGKSVLSDGRCGSIGYGIATAYAKEGANLVITGKEIRRSKGRTGTPLRNQSFTGAGRCVGRRRQ